MYHIYIISFGYSFLVWCVFNAFCTPVISARTILNSENIALFDELNQALEIVYLPSESVIPGIPRRTNQLSEEINQNFKVPKTYATSEEVFLYSDELSARSEVPPSKSDETTFERAVRSAEESVIFEEGTCKECHKVLVRDTISRCSAEGVVSTIVSYDGASCMEDVRIACVRITDRSNNEDGANVHIKSGALGQPFLRLNITSHPGKGYNLFLEMRGLDPYKPDCGY